MPAESMDYYTATDNKTNIQKILKYFNCTYWNKSQIFENAKTAGFMPTRWDYFHQIASIEEITESIIFIFSICQGMTYCNRSSANYALSKPGICFSLLKHRESWSNYSVILPFVASDYTEPNLVPLSLSLRKDRLRLWRDLPYSEDHTYQ